jgi:hypothetical protein
VAKVAELETGSLTSWGHVLPYLVVGHSDPNQTKIKQIIAAYYTRQQSGKKNSPMIIKMVE